MEVSNIWTFWIFKFDKTKPWNECLHEIGNFDTLETIWAMLNNTLKPNKILYNPERKLFSTNYILFKNGIKPEWEDQNNINGGRMLLDLTTENVCNYWERCVLCLVTNTKYPQINGILMTIRKTGYKIAIWINSSNYILLKNIANELKIVLNHKDKIVFEKHSSAKNRKNGIVVRDFIL